jgi:hypothetical protein
LWLKGQLDSFPGVTESKRAQREFPDGLDWLHFWTRVCWNGNLLLVDLALRLRANNNSYYWCHDLTFSYLLEYGLQQFTIEEVLLGAGPRKVV